MPSPFPGMNPWFEQNDLWPDFHNAFVYTLRRRLAAAAAPRYIVLMEEHVYIHDEADEISRSIRPDVALTRADDVGAPRGASAAVAAPARLRLPTPDEERIPFVRILDARDRRVVTVIELLSPTNKRRGDSRGSYIQKRREILASDAHLVEIDLLRGGPPMPPVDRPACTYSVLVSRAEARPEVDFWPIGLRDRPPVVPVPLRAPDPDVAVDLRTVLDQVCDEGRYDHFPHARDPDPPLSPEDRAWAEGFLPAPT